MFVENMLHSDVLQTTLGTERHFTHIAMIRPPPTMDALMYLKIFCGLEWLFTKNAMIGHFPLWMHWCLWILSLVWN